MTPEVYLQDSERTKADFPEGMHMDYFQARATLNSMLEAIETCKQVDGIKKNLFYGKPIPGTQSSGTFSNEQYENICKLDPREVDLFHAALGKLTEAGEVLENVIKYITSDKQNYDVANTIEEVGDGLWYDAILLRDAGVSFGECMSKNIDKLRVRFPDKFDSTLAQNRNLEKERKALENDDESTSG